MLPSDKPENNDGSLTDKIDELYSLLDNNNEAESSKDSGELSLDQEKIPVLDELVTNDDHTPEIDQAIEQVSITEGRLNKIITNLERKLDSELDMLTSDIKEGLKNNIIDELKSLLNERIPVNHTHQTSDTDLTKSNNNDE